MEQVHVAEDLQIDDFEAELLADLEDDEQVSSHCLRMMVRTRHMC